MVVVEDDDEFIGAGAQVENVAPLISTLSKKVWHMWVASETD